MLRENKEQVFEIDTLSQFEHFISKIEQNAVSGSVKSVDIYSLKHRIE